MASDSDKKYVCIREKQINRHETDITALQVRADYKEHKIEELGKSMHEMDEKLDKITSSIEDLKLQSQKDDFNIDNRVKALESKLDTLRWVTGASVSILGVLVAVLSLVITYVH